MEHRTVGELMTRSVVSVTTSTPFEEIARTLADEGVSALPVVDGSGRPSGVVPEADLLRKAAIRSDLTGRITPETVSAEEQAKAEGATAADVMSSPARCAHREWTVAEAARCMAASNVKRLPVVDEAGRLVGIVSRSDLLRVFLRRDSALHDEIKHEILAHTLRSGPGEVTADVAQGRVSLRGHVQDERLIPVIERLCTGVGGVVTLDSRISAADERGVNAGTE